jgi:hypothetical protein
VPLSDHEQRLLEQIEQALYDEDPKFARIYRRTDIRSHYRARLSWALSGVFAGLALLLTAVIVPLIPLGVVGFLVMLASATYGIASWQRMTGHRAGGAERRTPRRRRGTAERRSALQRLEDRWQRRQDGTGR